MSHFMKLAAMAAAFACCPSFVGAQEAADIDALADRGEVIFQDPAGCWVCHTKTGEGDIGPSLLYGPTPFDIHYQLNNNPQMAPVAATFQPEDDDLLALAVYIKARLAGEAVDDDALANLRLTLASIQSLEEQTPSYEFSERDLRIQEVELFDTVLEDWARRADEGSIRRDYEVVVTAEFDPAEPKFTPEPGRTYFYENVGASSRFTPEGFRATGTNRVVVGDAETKEVIAYYQMPDELRGAVHTTVMSPDGRYVYITGPRPFSGPDQHTFMMTNPATLLKVDAVTLQPVKQLLTGARLHHGQIFQDRYLLLDSFSRDANGLDVMLFDPETDTVIGGVRGEELGGATSTSWTDGEFIYVLMEPTGYDGVLGAGMRGKTFSGFLSIGAISTGRLTAMRPFWIAKIDPETWEVVREYPYPGYRADWITFDQAKEHMFISTAATGSVVKINLESGEAVWATPVGTGPYGVNLNADETQVWVANKGEGTGMLGRTITVVDNASGRGLATIPSGYGVDHLLLSPDGTEFWGSSNEEGRLYVFDAETQENTHVIDMPNFGEAHGLVWVRYDEDGEPRVIRDQGGFHNGVDPREPAPLPEFGGAFGDLFGGEESE